MRDRWPWLLHTWPSQRPRQIFKPAIQGSASAPQKTESLNLLLADFISD
jgi:hypothetical protein